MQNNSVVFTFQELMEKALVGVLKQQSHSANDPREMNWLSQQQRTLEKEISRVTQQLAEASKVSRSLSRSKVIRFIIVLLLVSITGSAIYETDCFSDISFLNDK